MKSKRKIYICLVLYLLTANMINKICVVMGSALDDILHLKAGLNLLTIASSTFLSTFGKFLGSFLPNHIRSFLFFSFLMNSICIICFILFKNSLIFGLSRSLQGFFSGIQFSLIFGLLGSLKNNYKGFANFTGLSSIISVICGFFLIFFPVRLLIIVTSVVSGLSAFIFYFSIHDTNEHIEDQKQLSIVEQFKNMLLMTLDMYFFLRAAFVGSLLGCAIMIITQQKKLINLLFDIPPGWQTFIALMPFIISAVISFIHKTQSKLLFLFMNFLSFWFLTIGVFSNDLMILILGIISPFLSFAIINPVVCSEAVNRYMDHKFIASSYFSFIRSIFTSISIFILPNLTNYPIIISSVFCFIFGCIYIIHDKKLISDIL